MVKYISVLGYITLIICACITGLIVIEFNSEISRGHTLDAGRISLYLIPTYIVGHYTVLTIKGRNIIDLVNDRLKNLIAYLNIGFFIFAIILPFMLGFRYYIIVDNAKEMKTYKEVNLFGDRINVQSKYLDNEIKYKVHVLFSKPLHFNSKVYTITFTDKDGFEVYQREIKESHYFSDDGDNKTGLSADFSEYISLNDYLLIYGVEVSVKKL